jgi:hypothetical protein
MVEIIRQGSKNLVDCLDCGSVLKYSAQDISLEHTPPLGPYDMEDADSYYICCPCGSRIDVSSKLSGQTKRRVEELEQFRSLSDYDV